VWATGSSGVTPVGFARHRRAQDPEKGRTHTGSTGKKKTTMAKLARESRLRERRLEKEARKEAKHAAAHPPVPPNDAPIGSQQ
jgi:hypothetical protein